MSYADGMDFYGAIISLQEASRWLEAGFIDKVKIDLETGLGQLYAIDKRQKQKDKAAPDLLAAIEAIFREPYGCSLCDSGVPRNPQKGHQPDCPYELARIAVAKAKGKE